MAETLVDRFAAVRHRYPHRIAVTDGDRRLSYAELDAAAERVARHLRQHGAGPGDLVGISMERSAELIVVILGVLRTGAAYVPLDPTYPRARLEFLVDDARCRLIVGAGACRELFAGTGVPFVDTAAVPTSPDALPTPAPATGPAPDSLAYVIHTSGSTGRPKGVMVTHANVTRLFDATRARFRPGPDDVWTMFHSYAFDFSVWEIWGALLHGGNLVVVPYLTSRAPELFWGLVRREGVTVLSQTPSAFRNLLDAAAADGFAATALRFVVFGGERLDPPMLRPWFAAYGDTRPEIVNMYGITETTVHVTARTIREADAARTVSPIGEPIDDLRLHLLDEHRQPVGPGERGELYVAGPGVARGYLNRPELTAQRFLPDPDGPPGALMYRSGDLASRTADGELVIHGRADDQIQLRGFRVELGEVEHTVRAVPGVRDAAVVPDDDGARLVAYVVLGEGPTPDIRAAVAEQLPAHAVPAEVRTLDAFPLTGNGKVDRAGLSAAWAAGQPSGNQQRLFFLTELAPESSLAYTIPAVVRLVGRLDVAALSAAVTDLVVRHPALRTGLVSTPTGIVTRTAAAPAEPLRRVRAADEHTAIRMARDLVRTPFDPARPPLVRTLLIQVRDDVHLFVLAVHHLVADGWSMSVLARDLSECYAARRGGTEPAPAGGRDFAEFVRWHRRQSDTGALDAGLEHWRALLRDADPVLELPSDLSPAAPPRYAGGRSDLVLPPVLARRVAALALEAGVTPYTVLLSCFAAHLARTTGRTDLVIGTPAAGRPGTAFDDTVGYFANTLPLRLRVPAGACLRDLLQPVHEQVLLGLEHQYVPFDRIVAAVQPVRDPDRHPLVQVVFGYHGGNRFAPALPGLRSCRVVSFDPGTARFDLLVEVVDTEDGLLLSAEYDGARTLPETAAAFLAGYLDLVAGAVLDPDEELPRGVATTPAALSALPARGREPAGTPAPGAPTSALEQTIAALYGEVLQTAVVGRDDSFFALGGDSIRVLRLVANARDRGLRLSVEQVFRTPTVAALAAATATAPTGPDGAARAGAAADPLTDDDRRALPAGLADAFPMAALQAGIIFHCQLAEDPTLYHDLVSVRLAGPYDPAVLRRALDRLAERHPILRTSFDLGSYSVPLQLVHDRVEVPLETVPVDPAAGSPREALRRWWGRQWRHAFDPAAAPLWRCHVLPHPDGTFDLAVSAHHAILDGWSFASLMTELVRLLDGDDDIPPDPVPYREFVALERDTVAAEEARGFWRQRLPVAGPAGLELGDGTEARLDPDAVVVVPDDLVDAAAHLAAEVGAQARHVHLAACLEAVAEVSGQDRVDCGVVVNGRPELAGAEYALGVFLNTVPVSVAVAEVPGPDLVAALARDEIEYLPHRRFPLSEMQRMAGGPLHRVRFNYADFHVLGTLTSLRRLTVADWWSCDRNEIPLSVEVTRRPMTGELEVAVRTGSGAPVPDAARFAEAMIEALRRIAVTARSGGGRD